MNSNENLPPAVRMMLMKEIRNICLMPPEGIRVFFDEEDMTNIQADLDGPVDTPFEGGQFRIKLVLGQDFPHAPPKGFFVTKIFHPNVSKHGEICVNTLKRDWKPKHGIKHVLMIIRCLLIVPNPESALNEEAGRLLLDDYEDFAQRARMMTKLYAKPKSDKEGTGFVGKKESCESKDVAPAVAGEFAVPAAVKSPRKKTKTAAGKKSKARHTRSRSLRRL